MKNKQLKIGDKIKYVNNDTMTGTVKNKITKIFYSIKWDNNNSDLYFIHHINDLILIQNENYTTIW